MAANQAILDATIRHAVFLEQLKSGEVAKFAPFLKEIDRSIRERLTRADLTDYTVARLERLLSEVDSLLLGIFDRYREKLNLDLVDIANYEAEFEATSLTRAAPVARCGRSGSSRPAGSAKLRACGGRSASCLRCRVARAPALEGFLRGGGFDLLVALVARRHTA